MLQTYFTLCKVMFIAIGLLLFGKSYIFLPFNPLVHTYASASSLIFMWAQANFQLSSAIFPRYKPKYEKKVILMTDWQSEWQTENTSNVNIFSIHIFVTLFFRYPTCYEKKYFSPLISFLSEFHARSPKNLQKKRTIILVMVCMKIYKKLNPNCTGFWVS